MRKRKQEQSPSAAFREAVEAADPLQWKAGLQAIKKSEGGGQISGEDPKRLLGGAAMDEDCRAEDQNAARWDYVLGYRRSTEAVAYFVEVHRAETSAVSELAKKLAWLQEFLQQAAQAKLAALPREFHWVASGSISIPKHVPQYRQLNSALRKKGLRGPVKHLVLT